MSEDIRVGIITKHRGPHLSYYMRSFATCRGVKQVAIADSTGRHFEDAGEILKERYPELKTYRNYRRMLSAEKPQLVLVTMEAHMAPRRIRAALESGAHVVCEKPSCVRIDDFQKLADLATSKNLCLMLAMANRFAPPVQKARELVQAGMLGKLFSSDVYMVADQTRLTRPRTQNSWVSKKALSGGGHLIWLGIHWLDLVQYITGDRVHKVAGFTSNVGGQPVDIEDAAVLSLLYKKRHGGHHALGLLPGPRIPQSHRHLGREGLAPVRSDGAAAAGMALDPGGDASGDPDVLIQPGHELLSGDHPGSGGLCTGSGGCGKERR